MAKTHEHTFFHFGHWKLPQHGRLSLLFLFFLALHGIALLELKVELPAAQFSSVRKIPTVSAFFQGSDLFLGQDIAFQLRFQDPSVIAKPTLSNLPNDMRLILLPLSLESELKTLSPRQLLEPGDQASLPEQAETALQSSLPVLSQIQKDEEPVRTVELGAIVIGDELKSRFSGLMPALSEQATDRPLLPTVVRVGVSSQGVVESALVENSSGNIGVDEEAVKLAGQLRFTLDVEKKIVWSTLTFYWPQTPLSSEDNP
ncbi:MAG: energy transducer TonB [Verrucomicrobiia bacterium]